MLYKERTNVGKVIQCLQEKLKKMVIFKVHRKGGHDRRGNVFMVSLVQWMSKELW